jgi:hypothetical protein
VTTRTRPTSERSHRDALEQLQEELRQLRRQREAMPQDTAALASRVARLESEVRTLRAARDAAYGVQLGHASLPEQLVTPFLATACRQRVLTRHVRFGLGGFFLLFLALAWGAALAPAPLRVVGLLLLAACNVGLFLYLWDDATQARIPFWSFGEEGFCEGPLTPGEEDTVPYRDVVAVEVEVEPSEGRSGRVSVSTLARKVVVGPVEDAERLGTWLRQRVRQSGGREPVHAD